MRVDLVIRGRHIGVRDLALIRRLITEEGRSGRSHISSRLCEIWDWRQSNGRFRQIACRDLLRQLHGKGLIELPPMLRPARRPGYKNHVGRPLGIAPRPLEGTLKEWRDEIELILVQDRPTRRLFNQLTGAYHYLGYHQPTGAHLKYLASCQGEPIGCLSFGPAAWKLAPRDRFLGWSAGQREHRLSWLINNDRFLILPWVRVSDLASWLLSRCLRRLRSDWRRIYQHDLALCETFIDQHRFSGTAYAAANWIHLGQTQGRGRNDRLKQAALPVKSIWIYPLRPDFHQILRAPKP